jgi:hypothetical protein
MHSLKNTVVAVGLLALAFMFYQSSSPKPQGEVLEPQVGRSLTENLRPEPNPKLGPIDEPEIDISQTLPLPSPKKGAVGKFSPPMSPLSNPESPNSRPPVNTKQQNLAKAIRNQAKTDASPVPQRSLSPSSGSAVKNRTFNAQNNTANSKLPNADSIPSPDNSFNSPAGGVATVTPTAPVKFGSKEIADLWMRVELDIEQGRFKTALKTLSKYHASNDLNGPQHQKTIEYLNGLAGKVIWSQEPHLEKGDQTTIEIPLTELAQRWGVTVPLIQKINALPESQISATPSTLKVILGPFDIEVNRDEEKMTLYLGELYGCQFDFVGSNLTPGKYHVTLNSGTIFLKTSGGQDLVIRGRPTPQSFSPQSGIISLADSQLENVCDLLTLESTVTIE